VSLCVFSRRFTLKDTKQLQIQSNNSDLPIVVYLGYSIHGNESSGTGAAIALAYYLLLQKVQS
jgi:hypothetical protein